MESVFTIYILLRYCSRSKSLFSIGSNIFIGIFLKIDSKHNKNRKMIEKCTFQHPFFIFHISSQKLLVQTIEHSTSSLNVKLIIISSAEWMRCQCYKAPNRQFSFDLCATRNWISIFQTIMECFKFIWVWFQHFQLVIYGIHTLNTCN